MKIQDFITNRKIKPAHAAGFLAHLKRSGDMEMDEAHLAASYRQFCGFGLPDKQTQAVGIPQEMFGEPEHLPDLLQPETPPAPQPLHDAVDSRSIRKRKNETELDGAA